MRVHITLKSANAKVGPIPVSTTEQASCPSTCPMNNGGCYARSGPLAIHWAKVSNYTRGSDWADFCGTIASLPEGQLWRHNQAGDLPHINGRLDTRKLSALVKANDGKRGFTYTHHTTTPQNLRTIAQANRDGLTVNLSANDLAHADSLFGTGSPVVVVLPADQTTNTRTPAGHRVVVCPAAIKDGVNCSTCKLCAIANRKTIIGFPAHGSGKKVVSIIAKGN
jgi:hypothetical protein